MNNTKVSSRYGTVAELKHGVAELWSARRVGEASEGFIVNQHRVSGKWLAMAVVKSNVKVVATEDTPLEVLHKLVKLYEKKHGLVITGTLA